ncbi:ABC transporter substrate-binding protein [Paenibacillus sp. FSL R5-0623]|uniref:ABC transporter substrate-binding protein n=1 Tax=Paenibacillus sp. FSL R5-0623 TaxID=2921651 RepID=UPI0030D9FA98
MSADYGNPEEITPTIKDQLSADTVNLGWYGFPFSIEAIAGANPDLIILGKDFNTDQYETLSKIAPTIALPYSYYEMTTWPNMMRNLQSGNKNWLRLYMVNHLPWSKHTQTIWSSIRIKVQPRCCTLNGA